jgi:hypothetical protein
MALKHPTAWLEFEKAEISEQRFYERFFKDGRAVDGAALVGFMAERYQYVDGMPELLARLRAAGYKAHAMSNYPKWFRVVEDRLRVSDYVDWTFVSCEGPMKVNAFARLCVFVRLCVRVYSCVCVKNKQTKRAAADDPCPYVLRRPQPTGSKGGGAAKG